jgi:hypothetical protein
LVSGPAADLDDAGADRLREAGLAVFRAVERVAAFGLVLGLVMGSSEVYAAPSAAPPQPRPGKHPAGQDPEARFSRPSHHSNAPIKPESQSILSKIVALMPSKGSFGKSFSASTEFGRLAGTMAEVTYYVALPFVAADDGIAARFWRDLILIAPAGVQRSAACNVYGREHHCEGGCHVS